MAELLELLLKVSIVLFMVGNLFSMGLVLDMREALAGLRNPRFVLLSILLGFVVGPGIAVLLAKVIPMQAPFGMGLVLLGLAPCAPFLPALMGKARGDLGYTAAFMVLSAVGTVLVMPVAVPWAVNATPGALTENFKNTGPIWLQIHGHPVRYRNIWVRELKPINPAEQKRQHSN